MHSGDFDKIQRQKIKLILTLKYSFEMNKQKKLKLILSSFKQKQLLRFFQIYLQTIKCKFYKSVKQISFSCYQSTCQLQSLMVNGYGKTSSEALISGINNIIDCLIQDEQNCEVMRQCLRKVNVSPYGLGNGYNSSSKKQLLSTEKVIKTVGDNSVSVEKKVLTMSANMSSNSKDSSSHSKGKSIKQEIFQYFNLQNLKVKNPNQPVQSTNTAASIPKPISTFNTSNVSSVSVYPNKMKTQPKQNYQMEKSSQFPSNSHQLNVVYKKIKQIKLKIRTAEEQNAHLKKQIKQKSSNLNEQTFKLENNFVSRPSIENKKACKKTLVSSSSKKLSSVFESGLSKKFITQISETSPFQINDCQNHPKTRHSIGKKPEEKGTKNHINASMRKCLVDISNINPTQGVNSAFNTTGNNSNNANNSDSTSFFATAAINSKLSSGLNSKNNNSNKPSILQDRERLRSYSMANQKDTSSKKTHQAAFMSNLNGSFDNSQQQSITEGSSSNGMSKKIQIPKLNLEILPNYHGKSNKSLNQSLMETYQKKNGNVGVSHK